MPETMPLISVIIPVYNAAPYLEMAVRSVLRQNVPVEIIVVDDGSTDDSVFIARGLAEEHAEVILIEQQNRGVSSARNAGLARSAGEQICFLDADDEYTGGALEFLLEKLTNLHRERGKLAMVRGDVRYLRFCQTEGIWKPHDEVANRGMMGVICLTRAAIETVGGFDEELRGFEDLDWLLRAEDAGMAVTQHERVVLHYRQHPTNATRNRALMESERRKVLLTHLRRRITRCRGEAQT